MRDDTRTSTSSWLEEARHDFRETFSELDVLLRAIDRFIIFNSLPTGKELLVTKNYLKELSILRTGISNVLSMLEAIIPERNRSAFWFQKFAESEMLSSSERELFKKRMYSQDTPEKSLYVLYDSFVSLKAVISDILLTQNITYMSFKNIGELVSRAMRENVYFNPFGKEINPEFDVIDNMAVKKIVSAIESKEDKKNVSLAYLYLFRFMRYLGHMDYGTTKTRSLHQCILIVTLLRYEIGQFRAFLEAPPARKSSDDLMLLLGGIAYQFSMVAKRVFNQELQNILEKKTLEQMRGKIQNSHGILKNLIEQAIVQLTKYWDPSVKEEEVFEMFITRTGQSVKLREDMYVLHRIISELEKKPGSPRVKSEILNTLMNYMDYFESFTFKLLRYDDYEAFSSIFEEIKGLFRRKVPLSTLLEKFHHLDMLIGTTLSLIQNRAELHGRPLDTEKAEEMVKQYVIIS